MSFFKSEKVQGLSSYIACFRRQLEGRIQSTQAFQILGRFCYTVCTNFEISIHCGVPYILLLTREPIVLLESTVNLNTLSIFWMLEKSNRLMWVFFICVCHLFICFSICSLAHPFVCCLTCVIQFCYYYYLCFCCHRPIPSSLILLSAFFVAEHRLAFILSRSRGLRWSVSDSHSARAHACKYHSLYLS